MHFFNQIASRDDEMETKVISQRTYTRGWNAGARGVRAEVVVYVYVGRRNL